MPRMTSRFWKWMSLPIPSKHPANHPNMHRRRSSTPRLEDVLLYLLRRLTHNSELPKTFLVRSSRIERERVLTCSRGRREANASRNTPDSSTS